MLDPDYILKLSEQAEEVASQLHIDIIRRVIRRVMLRLQRKDDYLLTAIDKWQLETLQEAGFLREELVEEIAKATGRQVSEIKRAFEDAGVKTVAWDNAVYKAAGLSPDPLLNSPTLLALLDRGYRKTLQEWRNYTGTTATAAQQLFIQVCDQAYTQVATGSISYTQAVKEAVEKVARSGVVVHYPSGWRDTIETATLRAVRTGVAQACADMTEARMEELDWDTVLTSAHLGARYGDGGENFTNHYWWQGKFYSRSGKDPRFPPLSVCGQGEVQGLCGPNCRHSIGPGDGVNNPFEHFNSEENRKRYDLEEHQRELERRIRNTKRQVQGLKEAVDNADGATKPELERVYQKKARLLQKQNEDYNRFCAENDLKPLQDRLKIAGWGRKQAASATAAARKVDDESARLYRLDRIRQNRLTQHPELALPGVEEAFAAPAKFEQYLFNPENPKGWAKGVAFTSRLGYDISNWEELRDEILTRSKLFPSRAVGDFGFGMKYEQLLILYGKTGRPANVVVGWIMQNGAPQLTSAYIKEVKGREN